jgi:hypothetical protein
MQNVSPAQRTPDANYDTFKRDRALRSRICQCHRGLIKVTNFLLDRQIKALEQRSLKMAACAGAHANAPDLNEQANKKTLYLIGFLGPFH